MKTPLPPKSPNSDNSDLQKSESREFQPFRDKQLWLTVAVLVVTPIVVTVLAFKFITIAHILFNFALKVMAFIFLLALIGVVLLFVPAVCLWGIVETFRFMHKRGFSDLVATAMPLSAIAFGIGVGSLLRDGSFYPVWLAVTGVTAVPLVVMLVYQPIQRSRQLKEYRKSEQNLIQP
ncbi:hypothetical protein [Baaleninema sp.]|uniref:hypothetical protein n=1 Tax=Baaleninema sp. TaxID=3101197 RepID=UPI003D00D91E